MSNISKECFDNIWKKGLIIFDTCSLLRMYEYTEESAVNLKDIFEYKKDDIWLPYQVKIEFDRKHDEVMNRQLKKYTDAINKIKNNPDGYIKQISGILKECEGKKYNNEFISELNNFLRIIHSQDNINFNQLEETARISEEDILRFYDHKIVERILNDIFDNVGDKLIDEGKLLAEFSNLVNKKQEITETNWTRVKQSCDYLVWKQILIKSKDVDRPILFVTADIQPNFWLFDNKLNRRIPHPALVSEYKQFVGNEDNFNMLNLHDFFEACSNYLNSDIEHLIKYLQIDEQIIERFDTWFPEELMDEANEYLENDPGVKSLIEANIDSYYDYHDIDGFHFPEIEEVNYSINEDIIFYEGYLTIFVNVGANYHCMGEDGTIDSTDLQLGMNFSCMQYIDWESEDSGRVVLEDALHNVEVFNLKTIWIEEKNYHFNEEYDPEEYDPEEYDPEEYDPEEYDPEDYDPEDYDLEEYDPEDYDLEDY
ncbi:PIN-like domain-containing protein [Tissierella sp.]|uniref:PIN-like domain-containing protein n=1 Tax=Tissierella sp. TaxID=41274 RepID=UPI00304AC523